MHKSHAVESPSGEGPETSPGRTILKVTTVKCPDNSPNYQYINFCNTLGLKSQFLSIEQHLSSPRLYFYISSPRLMCLRLLRAVLIMFPPIFSIHGFNPNLAVASVYLMMSLVLVRMTWILQK